MDRRTLIISSLVTLGATSLAKAQPIGAPSSLPPASPRTNAPPPAYTPPANAMPEGPASPDHTAAAPANAHPEVIARAHWISKARGGYGAARELCETILRAQHRYDALLAAACGARGA